MGALLLWIILSGVCLYGYVYFYNHQYSIAEQMELYTINMQVKSDYLTSKEAELLMRFHYEDTSHEQILESLRGEPLMIVSTVEHEKMLELTLLGSTESLFNWLNSVEKAESQHHIEIADIERKGNVVYVQCMIKSDK